MVCLDTNIFFLLSIFYNLIFYFIFYFYNEEACDCGHMM